MKAKTLLPFLVVLVILAGVAFVLKGREERPSITEQLEVLVPEDLDEGDIERLALYAGPKPEEKVILARKDDVWQVDSHFNAPVNADTISSFLDKLVEMRGEFRATAENDEALADYELKSDTAFHVEAYTDEGGEPALHLLFGKAPDHRTVFLRKAGGDRVYVEAANLRREAGVHGDDFEKAPEHTKWLDKKIAEIDKAQVTRIALDMPDKELAFERREIEQEEPEETGEAADTEGEDAEDTPPPAPEEPEYEWVALAGDGAGEFKESGLTSLLSRLSTLNATDIVDPSKKAEYNLDAPGFKAVFTLEGDEEITIEGGRPDMAGNAYMRVADAEQDLVYEVSKYTFEGVFPKGSDLFELPEPAVAKDKMQRIEISRPGETTVVLAKADEAWNIVQPAADLEKQQSAVDGLVNALSSWKPADFAAPGAELGAFDTTITVTTAEGAQKLMLGQDATSTDGLYVRVEGQEPVLVMRRSDATKVDVAPKDLFVMKVLDVASADVSGFTVTRGESSFALAQEGDAWKLQKDGEALEGNADEAKRFVDALGRLQADGFTTLEATGEWAPATRIVLQMKEGPAKTVLFSTLQDRVYWMRLDEKDTVFTVDQTAAEHVLGKLDALSEPAPKPEPDAVEEEAAENAAAGETTDAEAAAEAGPAAGTDAPAEEEATGEAAPAEAVPAN